MPSTAREETSIAPIAGKPYKLEINSKMNVARTVNMETYLDGSWEEFEAWIREKTGSDFRWRIRPQDARSNREMIAEFILADIRRRNGGFPVGNTFIEKT